MVDVIEQKQFLSNLKKNSFILEWKTTLRNQLGSLGIVIGVWTEGMCYIVLRTEQLRVESRDDNFSMLHLNSKETGRKTEKEISHMEKK